MTICCFAFHMFTIKYTVESKSNAKTKEKVKTSFLSRELKMKTSFSLGIKFVSLNVV